MEGFEYVVNPPEKPSVAFGSGLQREVLPLSGPALSPFMRQIQGEVREFPGPQEYDVTKSLGKQYASTVGYSSFVSKQPRLPPTEISQFPPIGTYDVDLNKPIKKAAKPFNVAAPRTEKEPFITPGPSTYHYHIPRPSLKINSAFGSRRIIWPAVAVICAPNNTAKCIKCGSTPNGDYWHNFCTSQDMCAPCMRREQCALKDCSVDIFLRFSMRHDFERFVPVRYCLFYHDHQGMTAATQILSNKMLRYKINKENYLHLYYSQANTCKLW